MLNRNGIPIRNEPDFPCDKNTYPSRFAARAAAVHRGVRLRQYFCSRCSGWHNTKAGDSE